MNKLNFFKINFSNKLNFLKNLKAYEYNYSCFFKIKLCFLYSLVIRFFYVIYLYISIKIIKLVLNVLCYMISKNMFLALFTNPAQSDSPVEKCIFFESKRHPKGKGHLLYLLFLISN